MKRSNTNNAVLVSVGLVMLVTSFAGCMWAPDLAMVRRDIERQIPGLSFDKKVELTLGPITLGFVRLVTALVPDARQAAPYLRDVRRVEVAVYEAETVPDGISRISMPDRVREMTKDEGWELAVKVNEADQAVWVMYKLDDDSIREVYVVVFDSEELVLVHAEGRLERLMARALMEARDQKGVPHIDVDDT